jgi:hypothetical protein
VCKLFISCGAATYHGGTSGSTQVSHLATLMKCKLRAKKREKYLVQFLYFFIRRQQATINTNKTTAMTNSNKYRNSALFLEQKRLAVQKNLRQLQESSISRDVIRSKTVILFMCLIYLVLLFQYLFEKVSKQNIIKMKTME